MCQLQRSDVVHAGTSLLGRLIGMKPSLTLLVPPVLLMQRQVKMSAARKVYSF